MLATLKDGGWLTVYILNFVGSFLTVADDIAVFVKNLIFTYIFFYNPSDYFYFMSRW